MKIPAHDKMNNPIAQIVLNTFGMPTAATQAGIAKTKIVLNRFRKKVSAVSESPTISASKSVFTAYWNVVAELTIISVQHVCQRYAHQRRHAKVADTVCNSHVRPMPSICQSIGKVPGSGALERYEGQEAVETELRLVDTVVSLREANGDVVAQRTDDDGSQRLTNERGQAHQTDLRSGEFIRWLEHVCA